MSVPGALRRIPLGNSPERLSRPLDGGWDRSKPILGQLYRMSDDEYHDLLQTPTTSGDSIIILGGPLERFTHSALWQPLLVWIPLSFYLFWWSHTTGLILSALLFGVGWLYWTLLEYCLHRWVFHLTHWWGSRPRVLLGVRNVLHFLFHGIHHKFPSDPSRVITPLAMSGAIALPLYITLRLFFPRWLVDPFVSGTFAGYLFYDYTHYAYHVRPTPKWFSGTMWFRAMKQRHHVHHFRDEHATFGVSVAFTDTLFGTHSTKGKVDL